jgi:uncharacterized membrane protein
MNVPKLLLAVLAVVPLGSTIAEEPEKAPAPVSFKDQIKPIFEKKCVHCHNAKTLPDRISFENAKLALQTDKQGKVYIVPGKPDQSLMIKAINSTDFHEKLMPMVGPRVTKSEAELFERWVAEGAPWPKGLAGKVKVTFRALE